MPQMRGNLDGKGMSLMKPTDEACVAKCEMTSAYLRRTGWRETRKALHLLDVTDEAFGSGDLGQAVDSLSVRVLFLPADPDAWLIDFDQEFWDWWLADIDDLPCPTKVLWGEEARVYSRSAIRCRDNGLGKLDSYLAIHRHGGIEFGLGSHGFYTSRVGRAFRLVPLVGGIWTALALQRSAIDRYTMESPWEISLAFLGTEGSYLGNVAKGWAEPESAHGMRPCGERNVLLRREIVEWPKPDEIERLALMLGDQIENAWGSRHHRFLARDGELQGRFDLAALR